jgi:Tol biopolymer transport system component
VIRTRDALAAAALVCALAAAGSGAAARGPERVVYWTMSPFPSIWTARPDGTGARRILRGSQNAKRARLSRDRRWVAFDGAPPGKPPMGDFDIQIIRVDGTGRRTLTPSRRWDIDAQWSPDGTRLSFTRGGIGELGWPKTEVWTVARDGSGLRRLGHGSDARWSPDGGRLVVSAPGATSDADLWVIDADGSNRRLLLASGRLETPAGWSPDGSRVLYTRFNSDREGDSDVMVVKADGTGVTKLGHGIAGSWSPDGSRIAYTTGRLMTMQADGSRKRRTGLAGVYDPDWR